MFMNFVPLTLLSFPTKVSCNFPKLPCLISEKREQIDLKVELKLTNNYYVLLSKNNLSANVV